MQYLINIPNLWVRNGCTVGHNINIILNIQSRTIHKSNYACCLQRACNDTPSSCLPWRKAKTLLFTLNQKMKLFWWLSAHAHILLIAHEVISINNSSCLLRRPHLSHRSNQMSTVTLSNCTYGLILEYSTTKQMKCNSAAHNIPIISTGKIFPSAQAHIKHQGREQDVLPCYQCFRDGSVGLLLPHFDPDWNLSFIAKTFMILREWGLLTLGIPWLSSRAIIRSKCLLIWRNVSISTEWIGTKFWHSWFPEDIL